MSFLDLDLVVSGPLDDFFAMSLPQLRLFEIGSGSLDPYGSQKAKLEILPFLDLRHESTQN